MVRKTAWPIESVQVVNLNLDEQNVRLDAPGSSQASIINDLLLNEDGMGLVEDIVANGYFDHDLPVITEEKGRLIVLEGNRRVAALKAILLPSCAPAFERKILDLIGDTDVSGISEIDVKISPDRDSAAKLISTIHTSQARRPWLPLRQASFYYAQIESGSRTIDQLIDEYPSVNIPTFISIWEMSRIAKSIDLEDPEAQRAVNNRNFPITNLQRLYENNYFRDKLGIEFNSTTGQVEIKSEISEFERAMKKVVSDIATKKVTSRSLNNDDEIRDYTDKLPLPPVGGGASPSRAEDFVPITPPARPKTQKLIPRSVICHRDEPAISRRLEELKEINYLKFPNVSMDSLRTLLEVSLKAFLRHNDRSLPTNRNVMLAETLTETRKLLDETGHTDMIPVVDRLKSRQPDSVGFALNSANHSDRTFDLPHSVQDAWDTMFPLIELALALEKLNDRSSTEA